MITHYQYNKLINEIWTLPTHINIIEFVKNHLGCTTNDVANSIRLTPKWVSNIMKRMVVSEILTSTKVGYAYQYKINTVQSRNIYKLDTDNSSRRMIDITPLEKQLSIHHKEMIESGCTSSGKLTEHINQDILLPVLNFYLELSKRNIEPIALDDILFAISENDAMLLKTIGSAKERQIRDIGYG